MYSGIGLIYTRIILVYSSTRIDETNHQRNSCQRHGTFVVVLVTTLSL